MKQIILFLKSEIWYLDYFWYAEFNNGVCFLYFQPKTILENYFGKFGPKFQNYQVKLKMVLTIPDKAFAITFASTFESF